MSFFSFMKTPGLEIPAEKHWLKVRGGLGHASIERIAPTKTTAKYVRKLAQLNARHASRSSSRTQPGVIEDESHVFEKARSPRCAPIIMRENHMGRETKKSNAVLG